MADMGTKEASEKWGAASCGTEMVPRGKYIAATNTRKKGLLCTYRWM